MNDEQKKRSEAAKILGRLGGLSRARRLTKEQLSGIGKYGAQVKYGKKKDLSLV